MAQGHRNFGCWRCGNTLHKSWECNIPRDNKEQSGTRKDIQQQFFATHPEKKTHQDTIRAEKYRVKQLAKSRATNSQMWELDVAITDVLRVFEKIESKLQTVETEGSHSLYGDSELFYKNTLALQDEMRSHLEKTRMIIASTKEKLKRESDGDSVEELRSTMGRLSSTRDNLWRLLTEKTVARKNIHETVIELMEGVHVIKQWCSEFLTYANERPGDPNTQKIHEQYIEKYHHFTLLRGRANFLAEHANLEQQVDEIMTGVDEDLARAKDALNVLEFGAN